MSSRPTSLRTRAAGLGAAALLLVLVFVAADTRTSDAAFAAATTNPANALSAATTFQADVASGTYVGNGVDARSITGLAFKPDIVIVKADAALGAVIRTGTMTGDASKPLFGSTALVANRIEALLGNGFQVGTDTTVNKSGTTYQWFAATADSNSISIGSYTGDGTASRSISGLGYSPEGVVLLGAGANAPVMRLAAMSTSFRFESSAGTAAAVTALGANGFMVGNSTSANTNGSAYHWMAFNDGSLVKTGSYTGNNVDKRSIGGVGFAPAMALVRSSSTTTARAGVWRPSAASGKDSLTFEATANDVDAIKALESDGFQLGKNVDANANNNPYAYLAIGDPVP